MGIRNNVLLLCPQVHPVTAGSSVQLGSQAEDHPYGRSTEGSNGTAKIQVSRLFSGCVTPSEIFISRMNSPP